MKRARHLLIAGLVLSGCARGASESELDPGVIPSGGSDAGGVMSMDGGPEKDGSSPSATKDAMTANPPDDAGEMDAAPIDNGDSGLDGGSGPGLDGGQAQQDAGTSNDAGVDAGSTSSADAGVDAGIDAAVESCPATNSCESATVLSSVAGDMGSQSAMASGKGSRFLEIEIQDTGGTFNSDSTLKAKITLTSPSGSNYDLFVKQPDEAGGHTDAPRDCSRSAQSSQLASGDDVVTESWADTTNSLGQTAGDGLILSIEVRHVSGSCEGTWNLVVQGNTN